MNTIINFEFFFIKYLCIHISYKESFKHQYKQYRNFINLVHHIGKILILIYSVCSSSNEIKTHKRTTKEH